MKKIFFFLFFFFLFSFSEATLSSPPGLSTSKIKGKIFCDLFYFFNFFIGKLDVRLR